MSFLQNNQRIQLRSYPGLEIHACQFNSEFYADDLYRELGIHKPAFLNKCVPIRKSEYLAGRHCAQMALKGLGINDVNIKKNIDQTPVWPDMISGSISHSHNYAIAAVAKQSAYSYVGIDCESIIASDICFEIKNMVINQDEMKLISRTINDMNAGVTLALSLKESFFKAIFPTYGVSMDFLDIEILNISRDQQTFQISCNEKLESTIKTKYFCGRYMSLDPNTLLTLLIA